jgi:hypothetical protein
MKHRFNPQYDNAASQVDRMKECTQHTPVAIAHTVDGCITRWSPNNSPAAAKRAVTQHSTAVSRLAPLTRLTHECLQAAGTGIALQKNKTLHLTKPRNAGCWLQNEQSPGYQVPALARLITRTVHLAAHAAAQAAARPNLQGEKDGSAAPPKAINGTHATTPSTTQLPCIKLAHTNSRLGAICATQAPHHPRTPAFPQTSCFVFTPCSNLQTKATRACPAAA